MFCHNEPCDRWWDRSRLARQFEDKRQCPWWSYIKTSAISQSMINIMNPVELVKIEKKTIVQTQKDIQLNQVKKKNKSWKRTATSPNIIIVCHQRTRGYPGRRGQKFDGCVGAFSLNRRRFVKSYERATIQNRIAWSRSIVCFVLEF